MILFALPRLSAWNDFFLALREHPPQRPCHLPASDHVHSCGQDTAGGDEYPPARPRLTACTQTSEPIEDGI